MKHKAKLYIFTILILMQPTPIFAKDNNSSLRSDLMEQQGIVEAQFLFERAPFRSCHASTIAQTKDHLVSAFSVAPMKVTRTLEYGSALRKKAAIAGRHRSRPPTGYNSAGLARKRKSGIPVGIPCCIRLTMGRCCCSTRSDPARTDGGEC